MTSPGPWDPVSSYAPHTPPGLPPLGSSGVRVVPPGPPGVLYPAVPDSTIWSPRDKLENGLDGIC